MTNPLLAVRGVETFYGKIQALRGVDIDVNKVVDPSFAASLEGKPAYPPYRG